MQTVSIIMPTYNRLDQLRRALTSLAQQTIPADRLEIIVVSDGSTDGTDAYLQTVHFPCRLVGLSQVNQGAAAARNLALSHATGDLVLFIDDDVAATPELVMEHLRSHQTLGENYVVLGPMLTPADFDMTPWTRWEQEMLERQYAEMAAGLWAPTARQFYTGNASLARRHLTAAGGFDTAFRRAEDVELAYRLVAQGLSFAFVPEAVGYHYAERTFASWRQIAYQYGRNDVIFTHTRRQSWLLPVIMHEYRKRHPLIRTLTRCCLSRKRVSRVLVRMLAALGTLGSGIRLKRLARQAYSGIYNLAHYQGIADELGGRRQFFELNERTRADVAPLTVPVAEGH